MEKKSLTKSGLLLCGLLASEGFVNSVRAQGTQATVAPDAAMTAQCTKLATISIPAKVITLPTSGAHVTQASVASANGSSYCKVTGVISPASAGAPDIRFEADLPFTWNGKALQFGGGGYNGVIPNTASWSALGLRSAPPPLAQGYLTFGDDSGHQAKDPNDASFAVNDEAMRNYAYMHIKKARDATFVLAQEFYGKTPRRLYFAGGSTGGREALTAAVRWPHDYAGVIANYPTQNFTGLRLWGGKLADALYANNSAGWIPSSLIDKITQSSMAACDELDGLKDGIVSNMQACRAGSPQRLKAFACPPGSTSSDCLTPAQLDTIAVYHDGYVAGPKVKALIPSSGGYNILEGAAMSVGTNPIPAEPLIDGQSAHHSARADQFMKFFIAKDPAYHLLSVEFDEPGPWAEKVHEVTTVINPGLDGWDAYVKAGGKVLLLQGNDDVSVSPNENTAYHKAIRTKLGEARADAFMRFYLIPGLGHGIGTFLINWDNVGTLDTWVEKNTPPPAMPVGYDTNSKNGNRSRPLCAYPSWPQYKGTGAVSDAASFTCAQGKY